MLRLNPPGRAEACWASLLGIESRHDGHAGAAAGADRTSASTAAATVRRVIGRSSPASYARRRLEATSVCGREFARDPHVPPSETGASSMLREITDLAQIPGERRRRWFASGYFD